MELNEKTKSVKNPKKAVKLYKVHKNTRCIAIINGSIDM
jgi:hypothetical protein